MRRSFLGAEASFPLGPFLLARMCSAALVPTFTIDLIFGDSADLIAIIALLATARFFLTLAGMDIGTSFGGIGSSREAMFATLAEPAMLLIVFCLALIAGSTQLATVSGFMASAMARSTTSSEPLRFGRPSTYSGSECIAWATCDG